MWNIIKSIGLYFTNTVRDNYDDENRLSIILDGHDENDDLEPENLITLDKTGKVTHINEVDGKIDGIIFFWKKEMQSDLKVNDLVSFTAYKERENEEWRAKKIRLVHSESWEPEPNENELLDISKTDGNTNRVIETTSYVENGQVLERQGRDIIISPGNIRCNLDVLKAEFLPRKGDFVQLYVTSTPNGNVTYDYLMPLRSRTKMGNITCWEKENNIGIISNEVVFHKDDCEPGYLPRVGDEVIADTIESEQGVKRWRALLVIPANLGDNDQSVDLQDSNSTLLQNKEGIYIPENTDFGSLKLGEEIVFQIVLENGGYKDHELLNAAFCVKRNNQQIILEEPIIGEKPLALPTYGNVTFVFRVKAKFCGKFKELFMWTFEGFEIARQLKFEVKPDKANNPFGLNQRQLKSSVKAEELLATSSGFVVAGIKPIKPSSFTPVSMGTFEVPHRLVHILLGENNNQQRQESEILSLLFKEYPYLKEDLARHNYRKRMHTLLDLEEIKNMIDTSSYNLSHAVFSNVKDYLRLKIPNLAEKRPSLLVGDRVIIQESDLSQEAKSKDHEYGKYEGFIHKVQNDGILIKFGPFFHKSYRGDEYSVSFYASRTNFRRLHQAINVTEQHMGLDWLFPQILQMHPVQVKIKESADDIRKGSLKEKTKLCPSKDASKIIWNTTAKIKDGKEEFVKIHLLSKYQPSKDINWYNPRLNINQKRAVKYILRGDARPLPYVIFGPPGTGKTVTVVETILQLLAMVTDSRLLIATPSNSAADLIAERLIESDMFTSGMLLRLISHSYAEDKRLPQNIVPISAIVDIKSRDGTPYEMKTYTGAKMKVLSRQEIGLHRITIGTCTCVGALYTMGFPAGHFTHIIIDEAGQATEPELLIPLGFLNPQNGQAIFAGDPLQLGPVVSSKYASDFGLSDSFLARLLRLPLYHKDIDGYPETEGYNPVLITKLIYNYRSLPEITNLCSTMFYSGDLVPKISEHSSEEAKTLKQLSSYMHLPIRENSVLPPSVIFHGVRGTNEQAPESPSWYNPQEVVQVSLYFKQAFESNLDTEEIGIVTPYQLQASKIREAINTAGLPLPKVGSVEEFQGQERMLIILSTVRSRVSLVSSDVKHSLGFVACPRRLNVGITRGRALIVIIGDPHLLVHDSYWRTVLDYCLKNNAYVGCDLPRRLLS